MQSNTVSALRQKTIYSGKHRGIAFEIHHRMDDGDYFAENFPSGSWTFYVFLHETLCADFPRLWLEDELKEWSAGGRKHVTHDYNREPLGSIELHCGATYYRKHGHTEGHRCVEIGCDYQHYWDTGHYYTASEVQGDAEQAIDSCFALGLFKPEEAPVPSEPKAAEQLSASSPKSGDLEELDRIRESGRKGDSLTTSDKD